jgi:hypothetical protein
MKMTADTQQISKTAMNVRVCKNDRSDWFGRPADRRFHKRTTARAARRLGKAIVRGAYAG